MKVKAVKVVFSGDGEIDKGELAKAIAEALPDDLGAEKESDAEPEGEDACEKCPKKDKCSDEKKSKHKAVNNAIAKGREFVKALHAVMDDMDATTSDREAFAGKLDKLAETTKSFADAIRAKEFVDAFSK
jgi:hypothetical protein